MIEIEVVVGKDGTLKACKASGHAGAGKTGSDIVCAAVSVLMRTAFSVLSNQEGVVVQCDALVPGQMYFEAGYEDKKGKDFLFTTGVFLLYGLKSVAREFPKNCKISVKERIIWHANAAEAAQKTEETQTPNIWE